MDEHIEYFDPAGDRDLATLLHELQSQGWRLRGPGEAVRHEDRPVVRYVFERA